MNTVVTDEQWRQLLGLWSQVFPDDWEDSTLDTIREWKTRCPSMRGVYITRDSKVVCGASIEKISEDAWFLRNLATLPEYRRLGLASSLLRSILSEVTILKLECEPGLVLIYKRSTPKGWHCFAERKDENHYSITFKK